MASEFNADDILEVSTSGFISGPVSRLTSGLTLVFAFDRKNSLGSRLYKKWSFNFQSNIQWKYFTKTFYRTKSKILAKKLPVGQNCLKTDANVKPNIYPFSRPRSLKLQ